MKHVRIFALIAVLVLALTASACTFFAKPDPRERPEWVATTFLDRYAAQDIEALEPLLSNSVVLSYKTGQFEILSKQDYLEELLQRKANFRLHGMDYQIVHVTRTNVGIAVDITFTGTECDLGGTDGTWQGDCFTVVGDGRLTLMPLGKEWRVTIIFFDTRVLYDGE